eukprot:s181_g23.t1
MCMLCEHPCDSNHAWPCALGPDNLDTLPMELSPKVKDVSTEKLMWTPGSSNESLPTPEHDSCSRHWAKLVEEERMNDEREAQKRDMLNACLMEAEVKNGFVPLSGTAPGMDEESNCDSVSDTMHDDSSDEGPGRDGQAKAKPKAKRAPKAKSAPKAKPAPAPNAKSTPKAKAKGKAKGKAKAGVATSMHAEEPEPILEGPTPATPEEPSMEEPAPGGAYLWNVPLVHLAVAADPSQRPRQRLRPKHTADAP